jgi:prepilin-type N-terminal cleavage/methylation domain-containing protein
MLNNFKKHRGFSLVELMIVCLLIAVLLAIAVPSYLKTKYNADKQKAIYNLYAILQANKLYYAEHTDGFVVAPDLGALSPDYANITTDDGAWTYQITALDPGPPWTFTATAQHKLSSGGFDGYWISIDQTGSIDDAPAHWPY